MGEARRRGTREQRIEQALARQGQPTQPRHRANAQAGIATGEQFVARTGNGALVDPASAVHPIVRVNDEGRHVDVVGTGFFVSQSLLITAKHVIDIALDDDPNGRAPLWCVQIRPDDGTQTMRAIVRAIWHPTSDIALCVLQPMAHVTTGLPLPNHIVRLSDRDPAMGERVFTYAYPDSVTERQGAQVRLDLNPHYYDGTIVEHFPVRRDSAVLTWPCFQTSIHIHGGASGGPVFDSTGTVFGINTMSLEPYTDVSYVTKVRDSFDLLVPVTWSAGDAEQMVPLRELAARGYARIDFSAPSEAESGVSVEGT